jgi:hypothetical protein
VAGAFVIAGGQGFVVLELVEAALDDVASPVGRPVEPAEALAPADAAVDWSIRSGIAALMPRRRR